jgi:hypothetical protein
MSAVAIREASGVRPLADAQLDEVSGGTKLSSFVINSSVISLPKPPYPAI